MIINPDKAFEKIGFIKVYEDKYIVQYERENKEFGYTQCLDLYHKKSGKHIIASYQADLNKDGFNNSCGITQTEAKIAIKKMKKLGWKECKS